MVRTRNKIVLLFTWTEDTPFIQASKVLHKLSESEQATPRVISIDSMSVGYEKAMSKIIRKHSSLREKHKIVMYEDRGENLSFFTNTIRHAQRHRLTAGDILSGPRRNERLGAFRKQTKLKRDKTAKRKS
ncbi:hypothetical protein EVAR_85892_1 [Eumeta japonica]|uniref:Uncharacterized protein n=1 Tax=Eumeta variegata TaxID=151549 RepID=A0A4C2A524_EUMVA|nr:hypothetical protein EVAR_85892_1 [Eumeta japonica]